MPAHNRSPAPGSAGMERGVGPVRISPITVMQANSVWKLSHFLVMFVFMLGTAL